MYRKSGKRVFIFGAGVSKAVAGAPVMNELFARMEERYEYEKKRSDCPEGNNRVFWFERIQEFINKLEGAAKKRFSHIERNEGIKMKSNIRKNIEYLITLLDMHAEYSAMFKFEQADVDWDPYPFIPIGCTSRDEIKEIRSYLTTYLYLCLCNLEDKKGILEDFFQEQLRPDDHLITFNYDLLIEKALWKIKKWSPLGGYIGVERLEFEEDQHDLIKAGRNDSAYKLLKLHGSIDWKYEDYPLSSKSKKDIVITLDNLEEWSFHFPELKEILRREPKQPSGREEAQISKGYAGGYGPAPWILPSYIKVFSRFPFFIRIWKEAQRILVETNQLVLLGYSLPEADLQSQLLLASLSNDCRILIVAPDADMIKMRMDELFQFPNVSVQNREFEEWVNNGCPGL